MPFYRTSAIETADCKWEQQPELDLCKRCGTAVFSHTKGDPEEVIREAKSSRAKRAEIILLGEMMAGTIPKDFRSKIVKTSTSFGQMNVFDTPVVRRDAFNSHYGCYPDWCDGNESKDKLVTWIDGQQEVRQGVTFNASEPIDPALQPEMIQMFHRTKTSILEYHLAPGEQLRKDQALEVFNNVATKKVQARDSAILRQHVYKANTMAQWTAKAKAFNIKNAQSDQNRENKHAEEPVGQKRLLAAEEEPMDMISLMTKPKKSSGGDKAPSSRPVQRGRGAQRSAPAPRATSRSPRRQVPRPMRVISGPSASAKVGQTRKSAPAVSKASTEEDMDVLISETQAAIQQDKRCGGRKYNHQEIDIVTALNDPDGGSYGRSYESVSLLVAMVLVGHALGQHHLGSQVFFAG